MSVWILFRPLCRAQLPSIQIPETFPRLHLLLDLAALLHFRHWLILGSLRLRPRTYPASKNPGSLPELVEPWLGEFEGAFIQPNNGYHSSI